MSNIVKIEQTYNLSDEFSGVSLEGTWLELMNYIQKNKHLLNKVVFYKEDSKIKLQSIDMNSLIGIINEINPAELNCFKKNLIRTLRLNLKFNLETKELELVDDNLTSADDLNSIEYVSTYENNIKNDVYFHEDALLLNYENISTNELHDSNFRLSILYFDEYINGTKGNDVKNLLCAYNTKTKKYVYVDGVNDVYANINLNSIITSINAGSTINLKNFVFNVNGNKIEYKNFRICKTNIILADGSKNSVLSFKRSVNNYIFTNFINDEYKNSQEI